MLKPMVKRIIKTHPSGGRNGKDALEYLMLGHICIVKENAWAMCVLRILCKVLCIYTPKLYLLNLHHVEITSTKA